MSAKGKNIVIIDRVHQVLPDVLRENGYDCTYLPDCDASEVKDLISDATGLVVRSKVYVDKELVEGSKLEFIARAGSGMDNIDEKEMSDRGIKLINAPEGNRDAVAEQTIGMMLNLATNISRGSNEVKKGTWNREANRGFEIGGKTVGIIGYGNCGSRVARKLRGFDVNILAYDKYKSGFGNDFVLEVDMDTIFSKADIVTFHIPLTPETRSMIDRDFVQKFDKPVMLLNLARGGIMKQADLLAALKSGKIVALGLDVLETEPPANAEKTEADIVNELLERNDVIITPHVGGWTTESYKKISEVLAKKIINLLTGLDSDINDVHEFAGKV